MAYPGFGRPCRATHPGLWRDRPYRGFAPLSTSWKEARWEHIPNRPWKKGLTAVLVGRKQGGSTSPNRAWKKGLTAAQAPAGRPNQSPGCVALQGRPNPGWSNTNSMKPCRGDPHPKSVSYQYRATARRSARRVTLAGLFVLISSATQGLVALAGLRTLGFGGIAPIGALLPCLQAGRKQGGSTSPAALGRKA